MRETNGASFFMPFDPAQGFMPFDALPSVAYSGHHSMLTMVLLNTVLFFFLACHE